MAVRPKTPLAVIYSLFTGLNALIKWYFIFVVRFHKKKRIDIKKQNILPPNNVTPQKHLRVQQSGCRATHKRKQRCVLLCNLQRLRRTGLSQSESRTGTMFNNKHVTFSVNSQNYEKTSIKV